MAELFSDVWDSLFNEGEYGGAYTAPVWDLPTARPTVAPESGMNGFLDGVGDFFTRIGDIGTNALDTWHEWTSREFPEQSQPMPLGFSYQPAASGSVPLLSPTSVGQSAGQGKESWLLIILVAAVVYSVLK